MSGQVHIFTSAACNYIPKVRMLFASLREHHPEARLHLALPDEIPSGVDLGRETGGDVHLLSDLGVPEWKGWSFCHDLVELSTAIKPFVFQRLLEDAECSHVLYLDPDTVVFSRLDDIIEALDASNILLTPHLTEPEGTLDAIMDNEISSLKHGIYNLGFLGVANRAEGRRFVEWWGSRTYSFCRADIPNGLFTDQRWIDLVPAFFDGVGIMRSPRHNVATWNLTTRTLEGSASSGFRVDGQPLGFYHFTGFDSGAHRVMAGKNAQGKKAVFEMIRWYESQTSGLKEDPLTGLDWAFGRFSNGEPITPAHRTVYRLRRQLQEAFPDPYAADGYLAWWKKDGPREFPKLFDPLLAAEELTRLRSVLAPVFGMGGDAGRPGLAALLEAAFQDSDTRGRLARRAWDILRTEGVGGWVRRLNR